MIETSLTYVKTRLNTFLTHSIGTSDENLVELSRFGDAGEASNGATEKVVIQLIRVDKVTTPHQRHSAIASSGAQVVRGQPVYLNLYLLVAANFSVANYPQALGYISQVIGFFQDHGVMDQHNSPDMPGPIEKLCFDIDNVGPHDLASIWGMTGAKYMPSVIYKMRLLTLGGGIEGQTTALSQPEDPKTGLR